MYHITSTNIALYNNLRTTKGNYISILTGIFVHNSFEHIDSNSIAFLIFAPPFFYFLDIKRGLTLFIAIGLIGNSLEIITSEIVAFYINSRGVNLTIFPRSAGVSGSLSGIVIFVSYYSLVQLASLRNKKEENELNIKILLLPIFYFVTAFFMVIERILADLKSFSSSITELITQLPGFRSDWVSKVLEWYTQNGMGANSGNQYLTHIWCMLIAFLIITLEFIYKRYKNKKGDVEN